MENNIIPEVRMNPDVSQGAWKVLVADNEKDIHDFAHTALKDFTLHGKNIDILSAFSLEDAKKLCKVNPDTALIFVNMSMENNSGLSFIRFIRQELKSEYSKIIIMTGRTDVIPDNEYMEKYQINGHMEKSVLTTQKLSVAITNALREYQLTHSLRQRIIHLENELKAKIKKEPEESNDLYRNLVEFSPIPIFLHRDRILIYLNPMAVKLMGYDDSSELMGRDVTELIHPEDLHIIEDPPRDSSGSLKKSRYYQLRVVRKDGKILDTENTVISVMYAGEPANLIVCNDVTERKKAENERAQLVTAVEQANELIMITDTQPIVEYVNPAFEEHTGYSREQAIGKDPILLLKSDKYDESFFQDVWGMLLQGQVWHGRITSKRINGTLFEQEAVISPLKNESGKINGYVMVSRDISHEEHLEASLRQAQKLEAIGTLAGGIAHDFNNVLVPILGFAQLMKEDFEEDSEISENLDEIIGAARRAKDLIQQILTFSREVATEKMPLDVSPIAKEALKLLRASIPSTIEINISIPVELGYVFADPTQIHQVIVNLCTNAFHAMEKTGGNIDIRLEVFSDGDYFIKRNPKLDSKKEYICLSVSDTGHGMSESTMERIFDPFFTTKEQGKGTGLGLATVHGIVTALNGDIVVSSKLGIGTTFRVFIPKLDQHELIDAEKIEKIPTGNSERILIVDDEETILRFLNQALTPLGYIVSAVPVSTIALEQFLADPQKFDMVITDLTMPKMDGIELSTEILKARSDIPVILTTGFLEPPSEETIKKIGIRRLVEKPVERHVLAKIIHEVFMEN